MTRCSASSPASDHVLVETKQAGALSAPLSIGADGRRSLCREAALIDTTSADTPQTALTVCFKHSRPHHDTSTEFHTATGQFTLVPLPGDAPAWSGCSVPPPRKRWPRSTTRLSPREIEHALAFHSRQGRGRAGTRPFPADGRVCATLRRQTASRSSAKPRTSSRRSARRVSIWACATQPPSPSCGRRRRAGARHRRRRSARRYDRMRRADVGSRTLAVDLLNRSLLTDFLPVQSVRGLGLYRSTSRSLAPRRHARRRRADGSQPRLMRGWAT